jgi:hypothetical protein
MAVKSKAPSAKEFQSRAKFKKTSIGNSVRSKPRGRKKSRGQGR